jgi:hypothetical protein
VQEAMNALNREYVKKTQDLTNELAYRKVIDKLSATLGTAFWHTFVSIFFLFSYFLLHFTFYILHFTYFGYVVARRRASGAVPASLLHGPRLHGYLPRVRLVQHA